MITAILSTFIVIGMAFVFIARRKLRNIQEEEDIINPPEAVDQDASRIRQELEQTADEIIQRMAVRIDRLELLIREADRKSNILQRKIEKLEKLEKGNDLPKVDNTGSESEFANLLNKSMAQEEPPAQEPEPDPDTYSIELTPDQLEAYLQSRSVDAIPDEPVKSLVDDEPEEYRPTDRAVRDDHPQEQAANLMRHMIRR